MMEIKSIEHVPSDSSVIITCDIEQPLLREEGSTDQMEIMIKNCKIKVTIEAIEGILRMSKKMSEVFR